MSEQGADERVVRLASIVAIDIKGFSTMSERDQRKAAAKVEALRSRIQAVASAHGGRLFNTAGDGFMLEFASAGAALAAIQDILDKRARGEPLVRVGAHVGDVIVTATNDLLGHGVNVAARLQELAAPGSALVSAEFRSMARSSPTAAFQSKGQKPLDNIEQRVQTFEILSRQQKLMRRLRQFMWIAVLLGALAAGVYFGPMLWRHFHPAAPPLPVAAPTATLSEAQPEAPVEPIFRDCPNCPEMQRLAGGLFMMGSAAAESRRDRDEGPVHEVSIAPFAMARTEVTFAQWDACLAGGGCNGYSPPDRGNGRGDQPVTDVSWEDAKAYLEWLNAQTAEARYRLPSEAEWEYAARAGSVEAYAFGPRLNARQARYGGGRPARVGSYEANAFGLFDMHGNLAEWVEDCYTPSYASAPPDGSAATSATCARRVFRGGSYADRAEALRSASRRAARSNLRMAGVGFRVARST